jgi:hypothetical protein
MLIHTVGDLKHALRQRSDGEIDTWYADTGRSLFAKVLPVGSTPSTLEFLVNDGGPDIPGYIRTYTVAILQKLIEPLSDDLPVHTLMNGVEVDRDAVGVSGENVDYSFNVYDRDPKEAA